jgi:excisionase family DNA binding protein
MPEVCYRTGQSAKVLGISSYRLRRLAESGLIKAEFSGREWRIYDGVSEAALRLFGGRLDLRCS